MWWSDKASRAALVSLFYGKSGHSVSRGRKSTQADAVSGYQYVVSLTRVSLEIII